jgi:hypothetical protein
VAIPSFAKDHADRTAFDYGTSRSLVKQVLWGYEAVDKTAEEASSAGPSVPSVEQLVQASTKGDIGAVWDLLDRGVDVNGISSSGDTPLTAAALVGTPRPCSASLGQGGRCELERRRQL